MKKYMAAATLAMLLLMLALTGCGGPEKDATLFIMPNAGVTGDMATKLQTSLQEKAGPNMTVGVVASPIFSMDKLMVEIAAGGHGILVLPKDQFQQMIEQGGTVALEDFLDQKAYPEGVANGHLYGIPIKKTSWLSNAGYQGEELFAFIPANAPDMDKAKALLKVLLQ